MNQDAIVNRLVFVTGCSRKQVLDALKKLKSIPAVRKELDKKRKW